MNQKSNRRNDTKPPTQISQDTIQVPEDELVQALLKLFTPELRRKIRKHTPCTVRARLHTLYMILSVLYFVLTRQNSFAQVHGTLTRSGIWFLKPLSVVKQSFYERFSKVSADVLLWLLNICAPQFHGGAKKFEKDHPAMGWAPFAQGIYALDDSTPEQIARFYFVRELEFTDGSKSPEQILDSLPGRLGAVFNVCTGLIHCAEFYDDPQENEKYHARALVEKLCAGCLLLFDLGYFSFPWFDWLTNHFIYFISRMKNKVGVVVLHSYIDTDYLRDRIVYLGADKDRAAHPVRLIEIKLNGTWWRYITNVLDPWMLPAHLLYALYQQRWTIERCFSTLKEVLGLNNLRLCNLTGVLWQVWGTLFSYQVAQSLKLEVATRLNVPATVISWEKFFQGFEAYYREAAGRTKDSALEWILRHHQSLGIIKNERPTERKVPHLPEQVKQTYEGQQWSLPAGLQSREPRYRSYNCGRICARNAKERPLKKMVGRVLRRRKKYGLKKKKRT